MSTSHEHQPRPPDEKHAGGTSPGETHASHTAHLHSSGTKSTGSEHDPMKPGAAEAIPAHGMSMSGNDHGKMMWEQGLWAHAVNVLLGVWLVTSPAALGYRSPRRVGPALR